MGPINRRVVMRSDALLGYGKALRYFEYQAIEQGPEWSAKMDGVVCGSEYSDRRLFCPRAIPSYWREIWLERVTSPASDADGGGPGDSRTEARRDIMTSGYDTR